MKQGLIAAALLVLVLPRAGAQERPSDDDAAAPPRQSDFVDTRLTFTFGDEDVMTAPGERVPFSPEPGFGDRDGYELFYDGLDSRFSGRESLAHLVLYREMPGFMDHVRTEAAMVLRLQEQDGLRLTDTGSYIRIRYAPWLEQTDEVSLTLFPFDSERFRLGYLWDLGFSGGELLPRDLGVVRAPAAKLQIDRGDGYAYVGIKATLGSGSTRVGLDSPEAETPAVILRVPSVQYGVLGGLGWDVQSRLRLEMGAGYFQLGHFEGPRTPPMSLQGYGGAARVAFHRNTDVDESIDMQLYRNDPNRPFWEFRPVQYVPGQLGYLVSVEGTYVARRLHDVDTPLAAPELTTQGGISGAFRGRIQYGYTRVEATVVYRQLARLLEGASPSLPPFQSVPDASPVEDELYFALAADHHFPDPHLTLGVSSGLQLPAAIVGAVDTALPEGRTLVVGRGRARYLPPGRDGAVVLATRLHVRLDLSEILSVRAWGQWVRDPNVTRIYTAADAFLTPKRNQIGFGISAAARF